MPDLRVAIDARLTSGVAGGVESVIIGLAHGLEGLTDGRERYLFLCRAGSTSWLEPYLGPNADILLVPATPDGGAVARARGAIKRAVPIARDTWRKRPLLPLERIPGPHASDGTIERAGIDVMHFTIQDGFLTRVPSIYHPHDLQHVHLPSYFSARERAIRDARYRVLCSQAAEVVVTSQWVRRDVLAHYGLAPDRVRVIPWAAPTAAYADPTPGEADTIHGRLHLPPRYLLYPAQTWPHKNHAGLLRAIALLRQRDGLVVDLVFSGHRNENARALDRLVDALDLRQQVYWTGFVRPVELLALYRQAVGVVIPSKFEAASGPLWEAFQAGVPAAVSAVTSLPEQAGDAALLFDPDDPASIAMAVRRLWTDPVLRQALSDAGRRNVARYDWDTTARRFRAEYRAVAGRSLSEQDDLLRAASSPL